MGELYSEKNEHGDKTLQILSVSIHNGVSTNGNENDGNGRQVRRSTDKTLYKQVKSGDLVLNMMRAWQGAIGIVSAHGMVSPAYIVGSPIASIDNSFMDFCLRRRIVISQIDRLSYGLTDFRKRLYWSGFCTVTCSIPSEAEQSRIGEFFRVLDGLIAAAKRKADLLKAKKRYYLQAIFNQRLRFKGYNQPWQQHKLSDHASVISDKNTSLDVTETFTNSAEHGIIAQEDYFDKSISNETNLNRYTVVKPDDFIYNPRISSLAPYGPIRRNHLGRSGAMSPLYLAFSVSRIDRTYLEWFFFSGIWHRYLYAIGDQGARFDRVSVSTAAFMQMPISVPAISEQTRIGEFFHVLDELTDAALQKVEALERIKTAYLQQLFV